MQITRVETKPVDRYLFVQVHTDDGIVGLGEAGTWGFLEAAEQVVAKFAHYLVGQDPLRIEHHWQYMYRSTHFRGAAIMGALSAIDIALWDIAGKHFGVPVYALLGAKTGQAIDAVRQFREAVGDDVDLCIEIHRRLTPAEAIVLARGIEPYHPLFYEDPILPDNFDAMGLVAENIHIPIATGERLHTIFEFEMLLRRGAVQFVRPDVCMCGGITGAKKVAALAEANYVG